ncbi:hypothetical protein BDY17DRAFT_57195 [Neohortaea acidophila]|uniref:Zinc finger PHD-type domain-containing protein n=1 Tax=Neohortaea acidophila TaxID=245834 RepID=A0A6A6PFC9_9PEZI|nr:uncharacterized protein BDY17DRAFT_57195 [Neohortaea acidophila]KAF2478688.1 hypothetical protein BDY17DRAFT_57195 [Neohortaea acidophila]
MTEDASSHKRAITTACYIHHRNKRRFHPRYLRRNLHHILDAHQSLLQQQHHQQPPPLGPALSHEDMVANEKRDWGWDFPTTAMLEEYMNGNKPVLHLHSLQIRRPDSAARIESPRRERVGHASECEWLPDPKVDAMWPCTVGITVSVPRDNQYAKKQLHHEYLSATILRKGRDGASDPYFDVRLDKPFYFKVDKLFLVTDSGSNGARSWKRTITAPYHLDISIQCQDLDDNADFLSVLESRDISAYQNMPVSEGIIRAVWEQIPTCPPDGHLLPLRRSRGHSLLKLDYQLEAAMGWISRREYALKAYNKCYNAKQQASRQLLTPGASDDMDKSTTKQRNIIWQFRDAFVTRRLTLDTLTCALCQDGRTFTCFGYLMLHCKRDHDHFDIHTDNPQDLQAHSATITLSAAPPVREPLDAEEDKEIEWVAPGRPFDLSAYLRGKDTWTREGHATSTKSKRSGATRPPKSHPQSATSALPASPGASRKRPALNEVPDLPQHIAKKHRVPTVPGVTFYHTTSKQQIAHGSYVSESDDEIDESWLAQSQDIALDSLGIDGVGKAFTRAFNVHLGEELCSHSSLLTRDALVRFARRCKAEWRHLFKDKLEQLRRVGVIGSEVVEFCLNIAGGEEQLGADDTAPSANRTARHDATATAAVASTTANPHPAARHEGGTKKKKKDSAKGSPESLSPVHAASTQHPTSKGVCSCGQAAGEQRGCIACADPLQRCMRRDFHLACVGLDRRVPGWRCAVCAS